MHHGQRSVQGGSTGPTLVVNDDPGLRTLFCTLLVDAGCGVVGAPNGHAALAEVAYTPPRLVIIDVRVPELDGPGERDTLRARYAVPPADLLHQYFQDISHVPLLSAAEEVALAQRIEQGDRAAQEAMILANVRLVISIATRYTGRGLPLLDLI